MFLTFALTKDLLHPQNPLMVGLPGQAF